MTITDNRNNIEYQFSDLIPGQVFTWDGTGSIYMAITPCLNKNNVEINAINFTANCAMHFNPSCVVIPLNAELVIK